MKLCALAFLLAVVVYVDGRTMFMGSTVNRTQVYHNTYKAVAKPFKKTITNMYYTLPTHSTNPERVIQGILAYDVVKKYAIANVTEGGIGFNHVNLRMTSAVGGKMHYNVYIYA